MESDIRAAQEAALEAVETDSIMTGTSANPEDSSLFGMMGYLCQIQALISPLNTFIFKDQAW
mgnify:CR=1 FL=1